MFFDFLRKQNGNVSLLQETYWVSGMENIVRWQWGCDCVVAGYDSGTKGVAVLCRSNFEYKIQNILKDKEGQYILIDIEMWNKLLTMANVHAPSRGDHPEFFEDCNERNCGYGQ